MYIDCHVHLRDEEQKNKETVVHGLRVAEDSGLDCIIEMPNTERPVTTHQRILDRFNLAQEADSPVIFGAYVGLTSNPEQIKEAVECCKEFAYHPGARVFVAGIKAFWGKSVGNLSIVKPEEQKSSIFRLAELNYQGVLAGHFEKESLLKPELFDPRNPITWSNARPEEAETHSIQDIINDAVLAEFAGHLHVCHVSTPKSVELVNSYRESLRISCGVTPHHLLLPCDIMYGKDGILYKVNPSLRDGETVRGLFNCVLNGKIDVLESDHAPHTEEEKREKYMSGFPNLASWPDVITILRRLGVHDGLIDRMAYHNVNRIFGLNIPRTERPLKSHVSEYVFAPYAHLLKA